MSGTSLRPLQGANRRRAPEVIAAGGLHIFGTERHEARRIENQLRGRAGRRAIPDRRLLPVAEDDLMRISAKVVSNLCSAGMEEGIPIESR